MASNWHYHIRVIYTSGYAHDFWYVTASPLETNLACYGFGADTSPEQIKGFWLNVLNQNSEKLNMNFALYPGDESHVDAIWVLETREEVPV